MQNKERLPNSDRVLNALRTGKSASDKLRERNKAIREGRYGDAYTASHKLLHIVKSMVKGDLKTMEMELMQKIPEPERNEIDDD